MLRRFSAGFAVGYVFGARAGQKRYEQITDLAERAMDLPVVNSATERASEWLTPDRRRDLWRTVMDRTGLGASRRTDEDVYDADDPDDEGEGEDVADDVERERNGSDHGKSRDHRIRRLASAARERGRAD